MILDGLKKECEDGIPEEAEKHLDEFIQDLKKHGLIGEEKGNS